MNLKEESRRMKGFIERKLREIEEIRTAKRKKVCPEKQLRPWGTPLSEIRVNRQFDIETMGELAVQRDQRNFADDIIREEVKGYLHAKSRIHLSVAQGEKTQITQQRNSTDFGVLCRLAEGLRRTDDCLEGYREHNEKFDYLLEKASGNPTVLN